MRAGCLGSPHGQRLFGVYGMGRIYVWGDPEEGFVPYIG